MATNNGSSLFQSLWFVLNLLFQPAIGIVWLVIALSLGIITKAISGNSPSSMFTTTVVWLFGFFLFTHFLFYLLFRKVDKEDNSPTPLPRP